MDKDSVEIRYRIAIANIALTFNYLELKIIFVIESLLGITPKATACLLAGEQFESLLRKLDKAITLSIVNLQIQKEFDGLSGTIDRIKRRRNKYLHSSIGDIDELRVARIKFDRKLVDGSALDVEEIDIDVVEKEVEINLKDVESVLDFLAKLKNISRPPN